MYTQTPEKIADGDEYKPRTSRALAQDPKHYTIQLPPLSVYTHTQIGFDTSRMSSQTAMIDRAM